VYSVSVIVFRFGASSRDAPIMPRYAFSRPMLFDDTAVRHKLWTGELANTAAGAGVGAGDAASAPPFRRGRRGRHAAQRRLEAALMHADAQGPGSVGARQNQCTYGTHDAVVLRCTVLQHESHARRCVWQPAHRQRFSHAGSHQPDVTAWHLSVVTHKKEGYGPRAIIMSHESCMRVMA
jgi:hypothetical protein